MADQLDLSSAQSILEKRIAELEAEVSRLTEQLTKQKETTEISERRETLYRMLAANLPNGAAFLVDHEFRYLLAEGQALQMANFASADFEGKTIREALDAETAELYEPIYQKALAGETFVWEHHNHGRDYISRGGPLRDEEGKVIAALALSYDITERKRTEQALADSE